MDQEQIDVVQTKGRQRLGETQVGARRISRPKFGNHKDFVASYVSGVDGGFDPCANLPLISVGICCVDQSVTDFESVLNSSSNGSWFAFPSALNYTGRLEKSMTIPLEESYWSSTHRAPLTA